MPGFFIEERCPKTFEGIPKRPKVLKTSKIRDFVIKGIECQFSKNVGLGKFLPNLEIPEAFVVGLKISFSGYFVSWGPFLESPGNFSGPKSDIQIEI